MNSATIRRLASDHASLHKTDLPPYYLFPAGAASIPDDLTQLSILLTGPQGTPYSAGVWKLHLKIPHDYPKSPPKASFRTKIWHPNVEESTGSVCVDTLKRDWQSKLTLKDILITISCLLIQPNPDSALNSAAGQLLQEDYETFSRQAKLMTSIHAAIPPSLLEAVDIAKRRGEDIIRAPSKLPSRKRPHIDLEPITVALPQSADPDADISEDEASASKENDPTLSPSPVNLPTPPPRRPLLNKRPLSDLPTPIETPSDDEEDVCSGLTFSERNIAANTPHLSSSIASMVVSDRSVSGPKLVERSRSFNFASRGKDSGVSGLMILSIESKISMDDDLNCEEEMDQPPKKRTCSGEGKENLTEMLPLQPVMLAKPTAVPGVGAKLSSGTELRKMSGVNGSSGGGGARTMAKPRVGLRRL